MRRSKIRPSINLAASRRLSQATVLKADNKVPKPPSKETTGHPPVPATETRSADVPNANAPEVPKPRPVSPGSDSPNLSLSSLETIRHEVSQVHKTAESLEASPSVTTITEKVQTQDTSIPGTESAEEGTSQSKDNSNPQRRRRISAKPNLGQHRMRLPVPPQPSRGKLPDAVKKNINADTSDTSGALIRNSDSNKPSEPPPVRRVVESIRNAEVTSNVAAVNVPQSNNKETSSTSTQPKLPTSKPTVHPKAVQSPSRPERLVEKRAALPPSIQDKRIRDLKALQAETPAKRRKRYIKKTIPPDRSKMTMSDLIYYNPKANPMKSSLVSKEKVKPNQDNSTNLKEKSSASNEPEDEVDGETGTNDQQLAPQVRIDADGKIVIDKESLTVEASPLRTFVTEDAEVVHEDSSNVTYASFRKRVHTTAWTKRETERFFMALSMVGTDFSMINALFPKRTRHQIKNKFKREERVNRVRVDKAIREKTPLVKAMFEDADSDVESGTGSKKQTGKKQRMKNKVVTSEDAELETEEAEFNDSVLDNDSDHGDADSDVEVTNILARPTRSGRVPKVRVSYDNSIVNDEQPVVKDAQLVTQVSCSPIVNGTLDGQRTPGKGTPGQSTPTTPMQTVYVVTPLQGGKQFMIRQHSIPQPSPAAIQEHLEVANTPPRFPSYNSSTVQQSPVLHLQSSSQQLSQTPPNSSTNMQIRMLSPQNSVNSPTGPHTVMTQRVGNTQIIVVSPATGPGNMTPGQLDIRHSSPSTGVQNSTVPIQKNNAAAFQHSTNTPSAQSTDLNCQNSDIQPRTFIRIQPGNGNMSKSPNTTAIPISGLAQQSPKPRQTTKKDSRTKANRITEVRLDEPFIPPSMKSKARPKAGANSINIQQKVIVQSLPQSLGSGYNDGHLPKHPEVLLLDDVTLAAQTEVVSDVAMEVEAECTNS
ncbi:uncharacterized protein LOC117107875 isoform X2 [Anneissia japonica]|uniref:uncharacterized protein LOC117107875 isoform X2 n=1 Tax=Anneissia japonica TaxID=1529436 RepID=UPI0014258F90|nr:uncharacterized protein LOC117107875 isoform X2 [Anneissia japonica]